MRARHALVSSTDRGLPRSHEFARIPQRKPGPIVTPLLSCRRLDMRALHRGRVRASAQPQKVTSVLVHHRLPIECDNRATPRPTLG
jgi:hypothetical protein